MWTKTIKTGKSHFTKKNQYRQNKKGKLRTQNQMKRNILAWYTRNTIHPPHHTWLSLEWPGRFWAGGSSGCRWRRGTGWCSWRRKAVRCAGLAASPRLPSPGRGTLARRCRALSDAWAFAWSSSLWPKWSHTRTPTTKWANVVTHWSQTRCPYICSILLVIFKGSRS